MAQHGSTTLTSSTFHVDFFPCSPDTSRLRKRLKNGTVISVKAWSALGASGGLRWHRNNYGLKPPTWRSPKSWGSPQIIHLFVMFHEINHSLNPGYPHDYGHLHIVVFLLVCFLDLAFGLPMSRGLIMGFNHWSTKVGRNYKTLVNHATKMTYMALSKKMVAPQKSLVKKVNVGGISIVSQLISGGWFGTFFFHNIYGIILPIDFHIFQRGWNHAPTRYVWISNDMQLFSVCFPLKSP